MSAKFTKGPWSMNDFGEIYGPDGKQILLSGVALPCCNHPQAQEAKANGMLFFASPMLYEALESLHSVQNGPPLIRDAITWQEAMDKAEAALRAARGEG